VTEDLFLIWVECELVKCDLENVSKLHGHW